MSAARPFLPRKRKSIHGLVMSQMCHNRTHALQQRTWQNSQSDRRIAPTHLAHEKDPVYGAMGHCSIPLMSLFPPFSTLDPVGYHVIVGLAPVSPRGLAMTYDTINVTPVTPRIGANIEGITLARPLTNRQVDELHQALAEHQV